MHNPLNALHFPSEVILDNQLTDKDELSKYPVIILSNVQCLSIASAETLKNHRSLFDKSTDNTDEPVTGSAIIEKKIGSG